jgi:transcriptional antiterminator NusG
VVRRKHILGHENKVRTTLERRIESLGLGETSGRSASRRRASSRSRTARRCPTTQRQFPGYILVNMDMNENTWQIVRQTPGVTQIVGAGEKPTPLSRAEVERLLHPGEVETREKVKTTVDYQIGETVKVIGGPLSDFTGSISDINVDQSRLKVLVSIFGRETPVELSFNQVAKL